MELAGRNQAARETQVVSKITYKAYAALLVYPDVPLPHMLLLCNSLLSLPLHAGRY